MVTIETSNLSHIFPSGAQALCDINIRIDSGQFLVLAGPNGSGKTVFARHLNGLLRPSQGKILLDGHSVSDNVLDARKKVGLIFQNSASQFVGQTVKEEVAFGPENLGLPTDTIATLVDEALERVGLSHLSNQNPRALSGGQQRRLAVAGVLVMKPGVIIFDEPFTGLDYEGVSQVLGQLVELHKQGHTILLITHELEKVLAHSQRLVVFHKGQLVLDGSPLDILPEVGKYGVRSPLTGGRKIGEMTWLI